MKLRLAEDVETSIPRMINLSPAGRIYEMARATRDPDWPGRLRKFNHAHRRMLVRLGDADGMVCA